MNRDKCFFRYILLHYFDLMKTAAEAHRIISEAYGEQAPSERTCREWFTRFKSGDFSVEDKERSGQPKKFEDADLQTLLDENPNQTLEELSKVLNVTPMAVSKRLRAMGKIQKEGKWLPHELSEHVILNRLSIATTLLAKFKKKSFLWRLVIGAEKWIFFDNPKRKKTNLNSCVPSSSSQKRNINEHKVLFCIWWDQEGVLYYDLIQQNEPITSERYQQQLYRLNDELMRKRPSIASNRRKVILLYENGRPYIAKTLKKILLELEWQLLPHPAYSPDLSPSDFQLFKSLQHALSDTHFSNYDEIQKWVDDWILSKDSSFYRRGIQLLPERWEKVLENDGKYFD